MNEPCCRSGGQSQRTAGSWPWTFFAPPDQRISVFDSSDSIHWLRLLDINWHSFACFAFLQLFAAEAKEQGFEDRVFFLILRFPFSWAKRQRNDQPVLRKFLEKPLPHIAPEWRISRAFSHCQVSARNSGPVLRKSHETSDDIGWVWWHTHTQLATDVKFRWRGALKRTLLYLLVSCAVVPCPFLQYTFIILYHPSSLSHPLASEVSLWFPILVIAERYWNHCGITGHFWCAPDLSPRCPCVDPRGFPCQAAIEHLSSVQPLAGLIKSLSSSDTLTFITFTLCSCLYESFFTSLHKFHGLTEFALRSHSRAASGCKAGNFFFQCSGAAAGTSKTCHCQVDTSQVFIRYSTFSALDICGTLAVLLYLHILHIIYIILYSIDELHNILISIERSVAHVAIVTLAERLDWSTAAARDLQTT